MALCSYKYKVDNYDAIVNDSSIKKGTMYGLHYDFKTNMHDFFTFEYALVDMQVYYPNTYKDYQVIASNYNPHNIGPCAHDRLPATAINSINYKDDNLHPVVEETDCILGFWPDDRARLVSEFNKYLDSKIRKYHAAKL